MRRCVFAAAMVTSLAASGCAAHRGAPGAAASPPGTAAAPSSDHEAREAAALLARGDAALAAGRAADAEKLFAEATEESPRDERAWSSLARARIAIGKREQAIRDLDTSLTLRETVSALALRGRQLGLQRRFDEAERDLLRAVELAPGDADAWAALGAVEINRGDEVEAERAFAAVVRLLGKVEGPDRFWTQLLSMPPDPVHPQESLDRCTRGRVALLERRWVDAHAEHLNGLRYSPRFAWCVEGLAEAAWHIGGVVEAERTLSTVIRGYSDAQAPLRADAQGKLAEILLSQRRAAEALPLVRAALQVRADRAALLDVLGRACEVTGDVECAKSAYERLLSRPRVPEELRRAAEQRVRALASARPGAGTAATP